MNSWRDGVEYAPHNHPDAFTWPRVEPLSTPDAVEHPAADQPVHGPRTFQQDQPVAALQELTVYEGPQRDPYEPFDTSTSFGDRFVNDSWDPTMPIGSYGEAAFAPSPVEATGYASPPPPMAAPPQGPPVPLPPPVDVQQYPVQPAPNYGAYQDPWLPPVEQAPASAEPQSLVDQRRLVIIEIILLLLGSVSPLSPVSLMAASGIELVLKPNKPGLIIFFVVGFAISIFSSLALSPPVLLEPQLWCAVGTVLLVWLRGRQAWTPPN